MIRLHDVRVSQEAKDLVAEVLESGRLSQGRWVAELEEEVAYLSEGLTAVAVSSGTAGLQLALEAIPAKPRCVEVIVPALSFVATANAILKAGFVPVFCDVTDDGLIDIDQAQFLINERTAAVMPVHLFGQWVDTTGYAWPVPVIEDAAQAIGLPIDFGVISLYGSKTIGAGEGGVIVLSDAEMDSRMRSARNQGKINGEPRSYGLNYRMTELQAAVALGQLASLEWRLARRQENAATYLDRLEHIPGLRTPSRFNSTWHLFTIAATYETLDTISAALHAHGVQWGRYYDTALPDYDWLPAADTPNARRLAGQMMQLPVHEHVTVEQVNLICDYIEAVL